MKPSTIGDDDDDEQFPEQYPDPEWTDKQAELFEEYGRAVYDRLETDHGREWYIRCWRPKKRMPNSTHGMMKRDHVKLGTPEDYVVEKVESKFSPMSNITSEMMRTISSYSVGKDILNAAVSDIVKAKLEVRIKNDPQRAFELLARSIEEATLYGRIPDGTFDGDASELLALIVTKYDEEPDLPHPAEFLVDHDWMLPNAARGKN